MPLDFPSIEAKWNKRWLEQKAFEANPIKGKKKFFLTFPYPYMNAFMHIGHFYTSMRVESFSRYKRMKGFNVLFPQGWHCTGSPIENAAQRIREKEAKQWQMMKDMGFKEAEITKFGKPEEWVNFFPKEAEKDLKALGFSVDWRRSFITTSLNPYYDKFIRWQFRKLKEKGLVVKGKHPVVWDPKTNLPVGDHDRIEGEGETPQDFMWAKFRMKNSDLVLMAGTTRPDALYGQSNLWIDPKGEYVIAEVGKEKWVVGKKAFFKIENQFMKAKVIGEIKPKELIGKWVKGPIVERELYVLPADFIDASVGSGIVYSALEDPVDLLELYKIQSTPELRKKFNLDEKITMALKPIDIINVPGMGSNLGDEIAKEFGVKSFKDVKQLEEAKGELNRRVFRKGKMNYRCGRFEGKSVPECQAALKKELPEAGEAVMFYELTGKVVSRSLAECTVKVVTDQWFVKYGDEKWKKGVHKALEKVKLYPETVRAQFNYVIDWLNDWACSREYGLGTRLPFDEKWLIESLSDSTIYMAYYTMAHRLKEIQVEKIDDNFFDYVLLGKGKGKKEWEEFRKEFEYWYPLDFRNSGKDLVQNHLTFFLFNHVAVFPEKHWPKGIGVNGWVTVNGEKMSKSKGNFILLKDIPAKFSADAARFAVLSGGEGLDDANFEIELAKAMKPKLEQLHEFCLEWFGKGFSEERSIDKWMESQLNEITLKAENYCDEAMFKSALQHIFFDLSRALKWYLRRTSGKPDKKILSKAIEAQLLLLAPFCPFVCEETWEKLGKKGFISLAHWPEADEKKIDASSIEAERMIERLLEDARKVFELAKIAKPKKLTLLVAPEWKWKAMKLLSSLERPNFGEAMKLLMNDAEIKKQGKGVEGFAKSALNKAPDFREKKKIDESKLLKENKAFLEKEFGCSVEVQEAGKATGAAAKKAGNALPLKPAIFAE
ncbi:MAG: leucine--tRNA ligase [Candidatus Diapherotrites archaeon]